MDESEQQKFLEDLDIKEKDVLSEPLIPTNGEENVEGDAIGDEEDAEMKLKNRRERRLAAKLQAEREANIALNARLQTISESKTARETTEEADYLKQAERIYGNDTPQAKEATELLKEALRGVQASAKAEALKEAVATIEAERLNESKEAEKAEETLDEMLEGLEDEYDIDFSDSKLRTSFLTLLEKVSPKDKEGNIIEYADPNAVYELYEARKEKSVSRAKELASRSMVRSGASQPSKLEDDSTVRFLKENGII